MELDNIFFERLWKELGTGTVGTLHGSGVNIRHAISGDVFRQLDQELQKNLADRLFWNTQQVMASSWNFEEETK